MDKRIRKIESYTVSYTDMEDIIEKHLGFRPDFLPCWEQGNDSTKEITVTKILDEGEEGDIKLLLKDGEQYGHKIRNSYSCPHLCMVELCRRGIISKGTYFVDVCW